MSSKPQFFMHKGRLINVNNISIALVSQEGCSISYSFQKDSFPNTTFLDNGECKKFMNLLAKLDFLHTFPNTFN